MFSEIFRSVSLFRIAVILSTTVFITACNNNKESLLEKPTAPTEVGIYTIESQEIDLVTELPGRTTASRIAEVRPQVNGIIKRRLFEEGASVDRGQPLYQIDDAPYKAALARAQANLKSAENLAKRYERLVETKAISRQQSDDAFAAWEMAKAEVEVASINMRYTRVLAPISGRISRSLVTEGALVTNGQTQQLATVTQLDPIYVDVTQPVSRLLRLQKALEDGLIQENGEKTVPVKLTLEDESTYPLLGTLQFSEVSVDAGTGSVTLRAVFPNPGNKLLPGMFVRAKLKQGTQPNAILVPQQAVFRNPDGSASVYVIGKDNRAELRRVETIRTIGNTWLVNNGVQAGERVVTEGLHRVQDGIEVAPVLAGNVEIKTDFNITSKHGEPS